MQGRSARADFKPLVLISLIILKDIIVKLFSYAFASSIASVSIFSVNRVVTVEFAAGDRKELVNVPTCQMVI